MRAIVVDKDYGSVTPQELDRVAAAYQAAGIQMELLEYQVEATRQKEPTEEEETPDVPPVEEPSGGAENPGEETGIGQEGDSSQGEGGNGSTGQPPDEEGETGTDTPPIVTIDPDDVLPDPESGSTSQETDEEPPPSQDIRPS